MGMNRGNELIRFKICRGLKGAWCERFEGASYCPGSKDTGFVLLPRALVLYAFLSNNQGWRILQNHLDSSSRSAFLSSKPLVIALDKYRKVQKAYIYV